MRTRPAQTDLRISEPNVKVLGAALLPLYAQSRSLDLVQAWPERPESRWSRFQEALAERPATGRAASASVSGAKELPTNRRLRGG